MGKATREAKRERNEELEAHATWLALQERLIKFLVAYTEGGLLYAPLPEGEWKAGFVYHKVEKVVSVPIICDKEVIIPAGWRRMVVLPDRAKHGRPCACVPSDPDEKHSVNIYILDLGEGLEIVQPGGGIAKLVRDGGRWFVNEPEDA